VQVLLGEEAYGISAGYAELRFTLRAWSNEVLEKLGDTFARGAEQIAAKEQLRISIEWTQFFAANTNDSDLVNEVEHVAELQGNMVIRPEFPFRWGEDFGLFTQRHRGVLFGLGAGETTPALHNPDYDFPEELIETGVRMFTGI